MLTELLYEKNNYLTLLFWLALGIFTGPLVYLAVPLHMFFLKNRGEWLWLLLGFWLVLTFSDSRQGIFAFAKNLKTAMMLMMGVLYFLMPTGKDPMKFVKPFIPFFIVAFVSLIGSPVAFTGFQKTVSYVLLLTVIPPLVDLLLTYERDRFLYHLVMVGVVVLSIGIALRFLSPGFVIFKGERYSGLLGNPNGMGIYGFLFTVLFTYIHYFHRHLFTRNQVIFVYLVIFASLVMAGSRGGLFSTALFVAAWFLIKRDAVMGFIVMALLFISYQIILANFEAIVTSLGLADYFRLETLETGSGRVVVAEVAWENIQKNYWFSHGFTYDEHVLAQYKEYFERHGHQGNVHNSWLTMWLNTGLVGLVLFSIGWLTGFIRASHHTPLVWALFFGMLISISVESWLTASLNPFTIVLVIILSMLGNEDFFGDG
ncbi:O-antigen ligase family protein [Thermophagus xiamenensis]|uniref:O-Antigen ligase n=1 Tax=Thermophagus xiamenensis TaxID=385682 RepID=A0A1I2FTJ4_9BACT|nr:O-antigen ligase family protein [Thermophagus xiamenensis]SFF08752.1 O-Antigen ligase [Thermophagus xiamenensis]